MFFIKKVLYTGYNVHFWWSRPFDKITLGLKCAKQSMNKENTPVCDFVLIYNSNRLPPKGRRDPIKSIGVSLGYIRRCSFEYKYTTEEEVSITETSKRVW